MNRDTRVVTLATVVGCAALLSTTILMQAINQERKSLELVAEADIAGLPPSMAIAQVALGSFRGLLNDVLWARANQLESEGRYHEAMTLSKWISKLQPHFTQVWAFRAFNMSYNISVATHTAEERWRWVDSGVRLLRDEALEIPRNKSSLILHVELARIYVDKLADNLDDYHCHYKQQMAKDWHVILGQPPQEGTTDSHVSWLEAIAAAPSTLEELTADEDVARQLRKLREAGYGLDRRLLHHLVQVEQLISFDEIGFPVDPKQRKRFGPLVKWLKPKRPKAHRDKIIAFTRAKLVRINRLSLGRMIELTREVGPLDWRHPASHGLYWATEGQRHYLASGDVDTADQEFWNLYRMLMKAAKHLVLRGDVVFDYITGYIRHLPDPQFFDYHETVMKTAMASVPEKYDGVKRGFREGRKNFFIYAAITASNYGRDKLARKLYRQLKTDYPDVPEFKVPFHHFRDGVNKQELMDATFDLPKARLKIGGYLRQGVERGIACRKLGVFRQYVGRARRVRVMIVKLANHVDSNSLPTLEAQLDDEYCRFMLALGGHLLVRPKIWRVTPRDIQVRCYDRLVPQLAPLFKGAGLDPKRLFPEPPGLEAWREKQKLEKAGGKENK